MENEQRKHIKQELCQLNETTSVLNKAWTIWKDLDNLKTALNTWKSEVKHAWKGVEKLDNKDEN